MRFHIVALPHTQTNNQHNGCAFTIKTLRFCAMMKSLGHEVYHYGNEGSDVKCTEHIQIFSKEEQLQFFGIFNPQKFYKIDWTGQVIYWKLFNERCAAEINKRKQPRDFVCIIMGNLNKPIAELVGDLIVVEYGIGYNGTFAQYRVFESYAHMHKIWGAEGGYDPDGKFYDCVINNYLDPSEFPLKNSKGTYYLYIGRLIRRKGIRIAVETCKHLNARLVIAGPDGRVEGDKIIADDGEIYEGEYVGFADVKKRSELYRGAIATFCPTLYLEPFGTVNIESQMSGTPVITTDFGAFTETVVQGKTGFRCRTLDDFVKAAKKVQYLDSKYIHDRAMRLYSMDVIKWQYDAYFKQLLDLWDRGWYTIH